MGTIMLMAINSDKGQADNRKNQGVKCASVNTGTDVISMCVVPIMVQYGDSGKVLEMPYWIAVAILV